MINNLKDLRWTFFLLVGLLWCVVGAGAEAGSTRITEVRISLADGATRVTLVGKGPLKAEVFTLDSPDRVVVDLPVVIWPEALSGALPKRGVVAQLRFGQFNPTTSRLVLDLKEPARVAGTELRTVDGKTRLQIELRPTKVPKTVETRTTIGQEAAGRSKADQAPAAEAPVREEPAIAAGSPDKADQKAATDTERPSSKRVVAIDAGHGGVDPGATGSLGTLEKNITLSAARELRRLLEATGRYRVVMTRNSDIYVPLAERVELARKGKAELFISLHADKHDSPKVRGASVYTLSETASDAETEAFAKRENSSDLVAGIDLGEEYDEEVARILISLVQQSTMNCSAVFASSLTKQIKKQTRLLPRPHRFAGFRVLKAPDVPSVLVEMGYLSNKVDEKGLRNASTRSTIMKAVVKAIDAFFARRSC